MLTPFNNIFNSYQLNYTTYETINQVFCTYSVAEPLMDWGGGHNPPEISNYINIVKSYIIYIILLVACK
jgi:hypothetical protein